mmetsp:Transcript_21278/g.24618  ORF Transcript_21278/g.24618 Transcript_21278/m.24618 type:complete len:489 (-) Transcript_21278:1921-3387(-)
MVKTQNSIAISLILLPIVCDAFATISSGAAGFVVSPQHQAHSTVIPRMISISPSSSYTSALRVPSQKTKIKSYDWKQYASISPNSHEYDDIIEPIILDKTTTDSASTIKQHKQQSKRYNHGVHPIILKQWDNLVKSLKKPTHKALSLATAAFIMLAVLFTPLSDALAAPSGGRMGGSFGGGGSSRSSSSRSYSSSPSYSRGSSYSRGYNSGYYARPSVTVVPSLGYPQYSPYYSPGGVAVMQRGPSVIDVFVFGVFALVLFNVFTSSGGDGSSGLLDGRTETSALGPGVTVAKISVALNVPNRNSSSSILTYLNTLSRTARTDSRVGVSNLVSQVALELLRQKRSIFAANTIFSHYRDENKANRDYSNIAIQERSKFERETISKYGGVDYTTSSSDEASFPKSIAGDIYSPQATAAVVTIILTIDGDSTKLPIINSLSDLESALVKIASDVKVDNCLRTAEVLWTPEGGNDILTETDVIVDYPELRGL